MKQFAICYFVVSVFTSDPSVSLYVPFICVFVCRKLSPHLRV